MLIRFENLSSLTSAARAVHLRRHGNNAKVYGIDSGFLGVGKAADIVMIDAPDGGTQADRDRASSTRPSRPSGAVITPDLALSGATHHARNVPRKEQVVRSRIARISLRRRIRMPA